MIRVDLLFKNSFRNLVTILVPFGVSIRYFWLQHLLPILLRFLILVSRQSISSNSMPAAIFFFPIGCMNALLDASAQSFFFISITVSFRDSRWVIPFERVTGNFQTFDTLLSFYQGMSSIITGLATFTRFRMRQVQSVL